MNLLNQSKSISETEKTSSISGFRLNEKPEGLDYSMSCDYLGLQYMSHYNYHQKIKEWCEKYLGKDNFEFRFEDYGQHGCQMLYTQTAEDLVLFKLTFSTFTDVRDAKTP